MSTSQIPWVLEWLWVPLWLAVVELFRRVFKIDREHGEEIALLKQSVESGKVDRQEMLDLIRSHSQDLNDHNGNVLGAVQGLAEQVKGNGRRLGAVEKLLMSRGQQD